MTSPIIITSRLLPGLSFGSGDTFCELSVEPIDATDFRGKPRWRMFIDAPGIEYQDDGLAGWGDASAMIATACSFLTACAESRRYSRLTGRDGENHGIFPDDVGEWAEQWSDELSMASIEIEEGCDDAR